MRHYLFITIDTEEDPWGGYTEKNPPLLNIKNIPLLQEIFDKHAVVPTYLINYPVATDNYSIELLKALYKEKRCDIGTHCHPWNNPPFVGEEANEINSFLCNLPYDLILKKLTELHSAIVENFHFTPTVFRAGRWGVGENVIKVIHKLGYKVDTSVTPYVSWEHCGGPKLYRKSNSHYGMTGMVEKCDSFEKCLNCSNKDECVVEIPPTMGFFQKHSELCFKVSRILQNKNIFKKLHISGVLDRLGLLNFRTLSPESSSLEAMVRISKVMMNKGHRFINMSFHSNSLMPGMSPFVKNESEMITFLVKIDKYLQIIKKENIQSIGMSRAIEVLS